MNRPTLILAAATLDAVLGDPESLPHPIRLIGNTIAAAELRLNPHRSLTRERPRHAPSTLLLGSVVSITLIAATYQLTAALLRLSHHPPPKPW